MVPFRAALISEIGLTAAFINLFYTRISLIRKCLPAHLWFTNGLDLTKGRLDILSLHSCALCGVSIGQRDLCSDCGLGLSYLSPLICERCRRPLPFALPESLCKKYHITDSVLKDIRSVLVNDNISSVPILPFKNTDRLSLT